MCSSSGPQLLNIWFDLGGIVRAANTATLNVAVTSGPTTHEQLSVSWDGEIAFIVIKTGIKFALQLGNLGHEFFVFCQYMCIDDG